MAVLIPLQGYLVPHAVGRVNFAGRDLTECSDLRHGDMAAGLTWPMALAAETFWDYIFSRENKPFKLLFQGPLAK